jgi:hypothetical protein
VVDLEAATVMMAAVFGELGVRLLVALTEPFAIIIADKAALNNDWIEFAMRERVRLPFGQSGIEALPLFESFPSSVYAAVAIMVESLRNLGESARRVGGARGD